MAILVPDERWVVLLHKKLYFEKWKRTRLTLGTVNAICCRWNPIGLAQDWMETKDIRTFVTAPTFCLSRKKSLRRSASFSDPVGRWRLWQTSDHLQMSSRHYRRHRHYYFRLLCKKIGPFFPVGWSLELISMLLPGIKFSVKVSLAHALSWSHLLRAAANRTTVNGSLWEK